MARLAIARDFLAEYARLEKPVRSAVDSAIEKFAEHTHAGIHLEKLAHGKDDRIRTIRVDAFWRGVVLAPELGDTYACSGSCRWSSGSPGVPNQSTPRRSAMAALTAARSALGRAG